MEITAEEYFELKVAQATLALLEAGGVDNWEWYSDSLHRPTSGESLLEIRRKLRKEILNEVSPEDDEDDDADFIEYVIEDDE